MKITSAHPAMNVIVILIVILSFIMCIMDTFKHLHKWHHIKHLKIISLVKNNHYILFHRTFTCYICFFSLMVTCFSVCLIIFNFKFILSMDYFSPAEILTSNSVKVPHGDFEFVCYRYAHHPLPITSLYLRQRNINILF